jgi:ADP-heptose:LPS heptosyltransferase
MGAGDWLMAAGDARALHAKTGKPVVIVDRHNRAQWLDLFDGIPYILPRHVPGAVKLLNGSGVRPYVLAKLATRWKWKKYSPKPAEVKLTLEEQHFAAPYRGLVMIEPNVKAIGHTNKAWLWDRWRSLVAVLPEVTFVQCLQGSPTHVLEGDNVRHVQTPTFRHAMAVLAVCRSFVGTEGGLMHAAAAVGVPSVILWSEFISPDITGYSMHRNIRHAGPACGNRLNCSRCRASMAAITVDEVVGALKELLDGQTLQR